MRITINISDELGRELKEMARMEKVSISKFLSENLKKYLADQKRKYYIDQMNKLIKETTVAPDALDELKKMRAESDRF